MNKYGLILASIWSLALPAQAEWYGDVSLATERVERGQSVSEGEPSAAATLGWRFGSSGLTASLGLATVSDERFVGSDGYQLQPTLGWAWAQDKWRAGAWLSHTAYPGAEGPWFGALPPRLQALGLQPKTTDYGTTEAALQVGWSALTLTWARALSDYQVLVFFRSARRSVVRVARHDLPRARHHRAGRQARDARCGRRPPDGA